MLILSFFHFHNRWLLQGSRLKTDDVLLSDYLDRLVWVIIHAAHAPAFRALVSMSIRWQIVHEWVLLLRLIFIIDRIFTFLLQRHVFWNCLSILWQLTLLADFFHFTSMEQLTHRIDARMESVLLVSFVIDIVGDLYFFLLHLSQPVFTSLNELRYDKNFFLVRHNLGLAFHCHHHFLRCLSFQCGICFCFSREL